jgi:hypothetical protein
VRVNQDVQTERISGVRFITKKNIYDWGAHSIQGAISYMWPNVGAGQFITVFRAALQVV